MPSFRSSFTQRPRSTAIRIRSPTPSSSITSNGLRSRTPVLEVPRQELALGVVAGEAERRLRQVVRAEREEVGLLGDLVGADAGPRQLDHRADEVVELALRRGDRDGQLAQPAQLLAEADQRVHDLDERRGRRCAPGPRSPRGRSPAPASRRSRGTSGRAGSRASRASGSPRGARGSGRACARRSPPPARAGTRAAAGRAAGSSPAGPPSPRRSPRSRPAGAGAAGRARSGAPPRSRPGSSPGRSGAAPRRRTCARCGRGRCPGRRTRAPWRRRRGCRRSRAPPGGGGRRPSRGWSGSPR